MLSFSTSMDLPSALDFDFPNPRPKSIATPAETRHQSLKNESDGDDDVDDEEPVRLLRCLFARMHVALN